MTACHISIRDVRADQVGQGANITVTTDIQCHLYMRWTMQPPRTHKDPLYRRGAWFPEKVRFCFVEYEDNEQEEAGDTLIHTFIKTPWPYCQCRYFYFWGKVGETVCKSDTPCFQLHMNCAEAPPTVTLQSNDCQLDHDINDGMCQYHNANSQTFAPDHDYVALGLSLPLNKLVLHLKGPLVVKLELPAVNCWEAEVIWSHELHTDDLPLQGDYRWTRFVLPNIPLTKDVVYRITVHSLLGWYQLVNDEWQPIASAGPLYWRAKADTNPYPRGFYATGCNYQHKKGSWAYFANHDYAFCIEE